MHIEKWEDLGELDPDICKNILGWDAKDVDGYTHKVYRKKVPIFPDIVSGMKVEVREGGCTDVQIVRSPPKLPQRHGIGLWRWSPDSEMTLSFASIENIYKVWNIDDQLIWERDE